jgi:sugar lactone lactonase YvrE
VDFFSLKNGVHAIEGLAHLGGSRGSIIRITRPKAGAHWQALPVVKLPSAPYAVSLRRNGTVLITLSDSLVSVGSDRKVNTLLADPSWGGFYPNSSILSPDEQRLYIGMRQFVGEFDLTTKRFRFLIPSKDFLNKLSKKEEENIRKQYRGG